MKQMDWTLYKLKSQIVEAIAHPARLAIVDLLADGEMCVCDITARLGLGRPNVSRHLAVMLRGGVLDSRKDGLKVIYSLRTPCITKFLSCVTEALRDHARQTHNVLKSLQVVES